MDSKPKPKLLVEALAAENDSGLGRHVRLFVETLLRMKMDADVHLILPKGGAYVPSRPCRIHLVKAKPYRLWRQAGFPWLIHKTRPRAVLCLGQTLPWFRPSAFYLQLIPDAGPLEDLGYAMSSHDADNRDWLRRMPRHADALITSTEFTRQRLVDFLGIDRKKVHIVRPIGPPGLEADARTRLDAQEKLAEELGIAQDAPYFLAVGNVEPRKNFPGLIRAYARLYQSHPHLPPLIIAGHKAWGYPEAQAEAEALGVQGSVHFTGFITESKLTTLMAHCLVFISSSLYEGWGLPLFEAMSLGKPSIYHRGSSQDEFAKGMALAVDCSSKVELAKAIECLWLDEAARNRWGMAMKAGFAKVRTYDLEAALGKVLGPYLQNTPPERDQGRP